VANDGFLTNSEVKPGNPDDTIEGSQAGNPVPSIPDPPKMIHKIKTDDPSGIEAYWHKRFQEGRKGGEWFDLTADDIKAFKRRNFM
jgi:hypothetical protein